MTPDKELSQMMTTLTSNMPTNPARIAILDWLRAQAKQAVPAGGTDCFFSA
jgi:hypothetical protein